MLSHSGEIGGFVAENSLYPDDKFAIAVLTNQEASSGASDIANAVADLLLSDAQSDQALKAESETKAVLAGLQRGTIDRSLFTDNCNFYFPERAIEDYRDSLSKLGAPSSITLAGEGKRGGMIGRRYLIKWPNCTEAVLSTYWMPDGKIEQFLIELHS